MFKEVREALEKKEADMLKNIEASLVREQALLQTRKANNEKRVSNLTEF